MFDEFDIPIFKQSYELYKLFYSYRNSIPKQERYSLYLKCENQILATIDTIIYASNLAKPQKMEALVRASTNLSLVRIQTRLLKDIKSIDNKKYTALQVMIDEIGRQLGGWIKKTAST